MPTGIGHKPLSGVLVSGNSDFHSYQMPMKTTVRFLCMAVVLAVAPTPPQDDQLELRFLDVGQGDAILVRHAGRTALIDAGPSDLIVGRFRSLGVTSIDILIASHNHADHIGGMDAVIDAFPVRNYLDNGYPHTTQTYLNLIRLVRDRGITYLQATARDITMGDAVLRIIPPPGAVAGTGQNNHNVSVLVERGDFEALLTGDSEGPQRQALLAGDAIPDVDVLKAAHHGSTNGVALAWLARTKPEVVVVSVGRNSYGHPHPAALSLYQRHSRETLRTDVDGDVVFTVNDDGRFTVFPACKWPNRVPSTDQVTTPRTPPSAQPQPRRNCCRVCRTGKACGNTCISRRYTCRRPPGCARNG